MTANENRELQIKILLQIQKKKRNAAAILRATVRKYRPWGVARVEK